MPSIFSRKRSKRWNALEMCSFQADIHCQLNATYWDHAGNHTVCQSAMDQLPNLHVSKKADEAFIIAYIECIREVYSHASGNLPELLFTEAQRNEERKRYWVDIAKMFDKVIGRVKSVDAHHPLSTLVRMAVLLSYASLYSIYKQAGIAHNILDTVHSTSKRLLDYELSEFTTSSEAEKIQLRAMHENIDLIYILREEMPRKYDLMPPPKGRRESNPIVAPETPLSAHLRDFPKKPADEETRKGFDEEIKKEVEKIEVEGIQEVRLIEKIEMENRMVREEPRHEIGMTLPPVPKINIIKPRTMTVSEYANTISDEVIDSVYKHLKKKRPDNALNPIVFVPKLPLPIVRDPVPSVFYEEPTQVNSFDPPQIIRESAPVAVDAEERSEPLQLTPFDPAECFKEQDKVKRYGRRGLFDDVPLPVIGMPKKTQPTRFFAAALSTPIANPLLSPTYQQKVEEKIVRAVLNGKPVSPLFPPPTFVIDDYN